VWKIVCAKFERGDDGLWRNARLEESRDNSRSAWQRQVNRGKASAAAREQRRLNHGSTKVPTTVEPQWQPDVNQSESESESERTRTGSAPAATRPPALVMSPLQYQRLQERYAFVGSRLRIPNGLHADFRKDLGGSDAESRLQAWYLTLDEALERSGEPIPELFSWIRPKFAEFAQGAATDAVKEAFFKSVRGL
jgi:hypothetical protein